MSTEKLFLKEEMDWSRLIQRLNKPLQEFSPFSFGGGLAYGGLSKEARDLLKDIFSFDYMGAAEFEWGAVPEALDFLYEEAEKDGLVFGEHPEGAVYYICPKSYENGVRKTIGALLKDENNYDTKRYCGLKDSLDSRDKSNCSVGWLELNNGYFFFIDKDMFEKTKQLFGLK